MPEACDTTAGRFSCAPSPAFNRSAFAGGKYGIAYQVLWVALQCGQRLRDLSFLGEGERLAESRYLDDHFPECEYSNKAAHPRGDLGLFQTAAYQVR